ncbi:Asp-tRNA(Asn)/Glu-tRNA(Gln) amidotransferase GatCAB subunit A [bacterium]|nr:Asp-tRNA(Asn)/Glu-tRNA(Gln) amidotransferase GatCAB subunit A [bacterium]|tara:strand:+ start:1623 stop:3041 length:1419 start_codon:yes stop_codon:yes gene_type:complete
MSIDFKTATISEYVSETKKNPGAIDDAVTYFAKNIKNENENLNAYIEAFGDLGEQVKCIKTKIADGEDLPLCGVPFGIKDLILIKDRKCSAGSRILEDYVATYDATVINRLRDAGAIFLGRTNMDEFAMGGSNEHSAYGIARNPHDTGRVPGGSSGGSAIVVAADMALCALGSDTGGSVRQPASFCGVVGMKPTYGRISRFGLMAMASSLDQIGPIGRTVDDVRRIYEVVSGFDENDATSLKDNATKKERTKKLAYPRKFLEEGIDKDIFENFEKVVDGLRADGYQIDDIDISYLEHTLAMYYIIMPAEASSNLARYDGIKYGLSVPNTDHIDIFFKARGDGFGEEVRRRIMLGTYVLSSGYYDAYYNKAVNARDLLKRSFEKIFDSYDGILLPTSPVPAWKIGERSNDPMQMYLADIYTVSANLLGIPAISVPTGTVIRDDKKLPIGTQVLCPWNEEEILFDTASDIENNA